MSTYTSPGSVISMVDSIKSLADTNTTKTNSDLSSINDNLLASEISIFDAIANAVIDMFKGIVTKVTQDNTPEVLTPNTKRTRRDDIPKTPIEIEFNELKTKARDLNQIIQDYNNINSPDTVFNVINKESPIQKIEELIDKIGGMTKERTKTIKLFSKFIIIAPNSKILQRSILANKVDDNDKVIEEYKTLFPGVDIELLQNELVEDALQTTLAKFVRAMTLLDNMKHRLNLKLMILNRNKQDKPTLATRFLSVAMTIDDALKRFVDEPRLPVDTGYDLDSTSAFEQLQSIRSTALDTVKELTDVENRLLKQSSQDDTLMQLSDKSTQGSDVSDITNVESQELPECETMDKVSADLIKLLSALKQNMEDLSKNNNNNNTEEEKPTAEEQKLIEEIVNEYPLPTPTTGGKLHKQKRRVKWSTPRRRRNSRVKSMKPKKIQNRRKTKSAHKKRGTKKH